jgi:RNA polymerase sigma-70 factor (ECF subfamily)
MISDEELVEAVQNGDRAAFELLVNRYERSVMSVAVGVVRDLGLAQDVTQDAFTVAFSKLSTLSNRAAFGPWVLRIARRCAYRLARKKSRELPLDPTHEPLVAAPNGKLDERLQSLLEAVNRLPDQERIAVALRYFNNESVEAVSRMTGRSVGTVTKQLSRARTRLKAWLGEQ